MVDISDNSTDIEAVELEQSEDNLDISANAQAKSAAKPALAGGGSFIDKIKAMISPPPKAKVQPKVTAPVKAKQKPVANNQKVKEEASEVSDVAVDDGGYKGEPLMTIVMRNKFYRDGYRNLIKVAIAEAIIIIIIIIAFVSYVNVTKPQDRYFATTTDGRIMTLVPLDKPNMSTSALMSWVAQATTETMTFGFHDYQTRLQKASRHFTRHGWEGFTKALQKSKIIESVEATNQVVTAKPKSAPILVQEGVFNGKYRWVVDLPLQINYRSGANSRVDNLMVRLVIDRVTSLENPYGVGIEQWIAQASSGQ